jgi:hypothetical protein
VLKSIDDLPAVIDATEEGGKDADFKQRVIDLKVAEDDFLYGHGATAGLDGQAFALQYGRDFDVRIERSASYMRSAAVSGSSFKS